MRLRILIFSLIAGVLAGYICDLGLSLRARESSPLAQEPDSAAFAALDGKLEEYTAAIAGEDIDVQCEEVDFLISSCRDSLVRQHVALWLYAHYIDSGLMGVEAVAVHVFDEWFAGGKVEMLSEIDLMNAGIYAEFNRQSLLGMAAANLEAYAPDGSVVSFPSGGRYSLLYFYDLSCSECKLQSALLKAYLREEDPDLDFYAFCVGQDEDAWREYRENWLNFEGSSMKVFHLWDPLVDSDFQMKYGVLQTPRLFMVDRSGVIIGRGLDALGLKQLIDLLPDLRPYEYGGERSEAFFENLFGIYGAGISAADVEDVARRLSAATLEAGDTLTFRHKTGDMIYWLGSKREEAFREGAAFVADSLILAKPNVWASQEDRLLVVGLASLTHDMLSLAAVGSALPRIVVPGVLSSRKGDVEGRYSLRKLRGKPLYLVFHSPGCSYCESELAAVDSVLAANPSAVVLSVDVSALSGSETEEQLLEDFDLSVLPLLIEADSKAIIRRRYFSFIR